MFIVSRVATEISGVSSTLPEVVMICNRQPVIVSLPTT
jgi:hypothetical protein